MGESIRIKIQLESCIIRFPFPLFSFSHTILVAFLGEVGSKRGLLHLLFPLPGILFAQMAVLVVPSFLLDMPKKALISEAIPDHTT